MNSLSWLLYLADVLPNFGKVLFLFGLVFISASATGLIIFAVDSNTSHLKVEGAGNG